MIHRCRLWLRFVVRSTSAVSAKSPPSPRLSARMMTKTYLTVTTSASVQTIKESVPKIDGSLVSANSTSDWRTA